MYTSNVDGHFQRSGFDPQQILECHGSLNHLQCLSGCGQEIWSAEHCKIKVDDSTLRAAHPLPSCPTCGNLARPNVLMFGDWGWDSSRASEQQRWQQRWLINKTNSKMVVIEIGAGKAIPTVRMHCEGMLDEEKSRLIRINPRESETPAGNASLPMGGLEALQRIDAIIAARK